MAGASRILGRSVVGASVGAVAAALTWASLQPGSAAALASELIDRLAPPRNTTQFVVADTETDTAHVFDRLGEVRRALAGSVQLTMAGTPHWSGSWSDLGVGLDDSESARRLSLAHDARDSWQVRWFGANQPSQPSGVVRIDPVLETKREVFEALLVELKEDLDVRIRPARFDWNTRRISAPQPGKFVDVDESWQRLLQAARSGKRHVELAVETLDPREFLDGVTALNPTRLVASYQTRFKRSGGDAQRARNIEVAAARIHGVILAPQSMMSFNDQVGPRSKDNGFEESWQIYKGEMVRGVGGGTCQVSSTLHAAALHAGLEIVERYPHSRALGYIPVGMDSTVSWPAIDFKLRNPFDVPMVIHAEVVDQELNVEIFAESVPGRVAVHRETLEVLPFDREVEVNEWFSPTRIKRKQKGISGYRVLRTRSVRLNDGTTRRERQVDYYPPTPELFHVGRDVDVENDLPPLPDGARNPDDEATMDPDSERG